MTGKSKEHEEARARAKNYVVKSLAQCSDVSEGQLRMVIDVATFEMKSGLVMHLPILVMK